MSQPPTKGDNFGGLPKKTLDLVLSLFSPTLQTGISPQVAINALVHLVNEEHAALNPGAGTAGFMDVLEAFNELKAAVGDVKSAKSGFDAKVGVLIKKLDNVAKLWSIGPVGFFTTEH